MFSELIDKMVKDVQVVMILKKAGGKVELCGKDVDEAMDILVANRFKTTREGDKITLEIIDK